MVEGSESRRAFFRVCTTFSQFFRTIQTVLFFPHQEKLLNNFNNTFTIFCFFCFAISNTVDIEQELMRQLAPIRRLRYLQYGKSMCARRIGHFGRLALNVTQHNNTEKQTISKSRSWRTLEQKMSRYFFHLWLFCCSFAVSPVGEKEGTRLK